MSLHDATVKNVREGLPDHIASWVDSVYPCICDEAYTGRGLHAYDCQYAFVLDVLDTIIHDSPLTLN